MDKVALGSVTDGVADASPSTPSPAAFRYSLLSQGLPEV